MNPLFASGLRKVADWLLPSRIKMDIADRKWVAHAEEIEKKFRDAGLNIYSFEISPKLLGGSFHYIGLDFDTIDALMGVDDSSRAAAFFEIMTAVGHHRDYYSFESHQYAPAFIEDPRGWSNLHQTLEGRYRMAEKSGVTSYVNDVVLLSLAITPSRYFASNQLLNEEDFFIMGNLLSYYSFVDVYRMVRSNLSLRELYGFAESGVDPELVISLHQGRVF
jgi:hypothetical protein